MANNNFTCSCFSIFTPNPPSTTPSCEDSSKCLKLGTITVKPSDSVAPCGVQGIVPFDCFTFTGCAEASTPTFEILNKVNPELFTIDSINTTGLTFTTANQTDFIPNQKFEVLFKASCLSESGEVISDFGTVVVYLKSLCGGIADTNSDCNPCDGKWVATQGGTFDALGPHSSTATKSSDCADPITYDIVDYDDTVLENVSMSVTGQLLYDVVCTENLPNSTIVTYSASACGATSISTFNVNINLCEGVTCDTCEYCNQCNGVCTPFPAKTVTLGDYDPTILTGVAIDTNELITYTVICSSLLPKDTVVNYTVVECGVTTEKTQTLSIPCPEGCCECPLLSQESIDVDCQGCKGLKSDCVDPNAGFSITEIVSE